MYYLRAVDTSRPKFTDLSRLTRQTDRMRVNKFSFPTQRTVSEKPPLRLDPYPEMDKTPE